MMTRLNIKNGLWWLGQGLKKMGFWGVLGACLLMIAVSIYRVKVMQLNAAMRSDNVNFERIQSEKNQANTADAAIENQTHYQEMDALLQALPQAKALPHLLLNINAHAIAHHLSLNSGDYQFIQTQLNQAKNKPVSALDSLVKYEVQLPVTGKYHDIRAFISQVLFDFPALALVDLTFKRDSLQAPEIEAELMLTIYAKADYAEEGSDAP